MSDDFQRLDTLDDAILHATQGGLPLVPRPYDAVAAAVGSDGATVRDRLAAMLRDGIVRRIGVVPNHYALGYRHNGMTVWDVDEANIETAGERVAALPFVSHCYHRPRRPPGWPYTLFAMIHARDAATAAALVAEIAAVLGPLARGHDALYSTRILKKTGLRLG